MASLPPSPPGLPLLGHLLEQLRNPLVFLGQTSRLHGDTVLLKLGPLRVFFVNGAADIEQVLLTDARCYSKDRFMRDLRQVVGMGLLTSEGDFWRRQRRLSQPAFHRQRILGYGDAMVQVTQDALRSWMPGQVRDVRDELMEITLEVVGRTLFSSATRGLAAEVGRALEVVMEHYGTPLFIAVPQLNRLPLPPILRFRAAVAALDRLIRGVIARHREQGRDQGDLLSMLLEARDEDGSAMSDQQLRDEVITLFLAGHETTALALSWCFYLLSMHPEVDRKLHDELREVLGGRAPTADDVPRLPYTEAVLLETMRLYPPAWTVGREAVTDTKIGPYEVRAGDQVWMSQWVAHRDPRRFAAPLSFWPERWLDGLQKRLHRFDYFPFGGGPRLCIGNNFAMMEATLLLATIAQRYRLELLPGQTVTPFPSITLRPTGTMRALLVAR